MPSLEVVVGRGAADIRLKDVPNPRTRIPHLPSLLELRKPQTHPFYHMAGAVILMALAFQAKWINLGTIELATLFA